MKWNLLSEARWLDKKHQQPVCPVLIPIKQLGNNNGKFQSLCYRTTPKTPLREVQTEVLLVCHTSATNEQSKGPELMIKHIIRGVGACRIYWGIPDGIARGKYLHLNFCEPAWKTANTQSILFYSSQAPINKPALHYIFSRLIWIHKKLNIILNITIVADVCR